MGVTHGNHVVLENPRRHGVCRNDADISHHSFEHTITVTVDLSKLTSDYCSHKHTLGYHSHHTCTLIDS